MNPLFEKLLITRGMEYLIIEGNLLILETSSGVQRFADFPNRFLLGEDVRIGFPELIGVEDFLIDVLEKRQMSFELKAMTRVLENGSLLYINLSVIDYHEENDPNQLILFFEDVTERMALEQTLVQSSNEMGLVLSTLAAAKAYIDQVITSIADVLLVTTKSGNMKKVNIAAQNLFGYQEEELIGNPISMIIASDNFLLEIIKYHQSSIGELFKDVEVVCQTKAGEKIPIEFSCSAIQTDIEDLQDFIYIGRDITERKRSQRRMLAQYSTTRILSESTTLEQATPKILLALCESLGLDVGELWMIEEVGNENSNMNNQNKEFSRPNFILRCVENWVRPSINISEFTELSKQIYLTSGMGLPGHIWAINSPYWATDVINDPNFQHGVVAAKMGLRSAFGFPILDGSEVLGVMTFFSCKQEKSDLDLLQAIAAIGRQIGQFIQRKRAEIALHHEQKQTERLLLNILPQSIAESLKHGEKIIAQDFAEATVLFADIVGFTELSTRTSPSELVEILNVIFSEFDHLAEQHGLEKIKTIGDAYMVVGGLPVPRPDHAQAMAEMALDIQLAIAQFSTQTGEPLNIRIGINTGPVVAGVIGIKKFIYDLWGDTVNTASRMESHGLPGQIHVTAATYECLRSQYLFEERGTIQVKGKGEMNTYFLMSRKSPKSE